MNDTRSQAIECMAQNGSGTLSEYRLHDAERAFDRLLAAGFVVLAPGIESLAVRDALRRHHDLSHVPDLGQIPGEFQAHTNSELSNEQVRGDGGDSKD